MTTSRLPRRALAAAITLAAGLTVLPGATAQAEPRHERAANVQLTGRGFGHGHGMSQYGARGAAQLGLTYQQIMNFYYPGTTLGNAGGTVSVLISADTSSDVIVAPRPKLTIRSLSNGKPIALRKAAAKRWRIKPMAGNRSRVDYRGPNKWVKFRILRGSAEFNAGGAPIKLFLPRGSVSYRGVLRSIGGDTVNIVTLEAYLRGVVPREMPALWHPQAVASQAVAARTYAAFERSQPLAKHYQICDTSLCQVYGGVDDEHPASNAAIQATKGRIVTFEGSPAFAQFSSSNGGWASEGSQPYLSAHQDPYEAKSGNPNATWQATLTPAALERAFPTLGSFVSLAVTARDGDGQGGGRAVTVEITGSKRTGSVTGDTFRSIFGLKSTYFTVN